jgi:hypothetical protein
MPAIRFKPRLGHDLRLHRLAKRLHLPNIQQVQEAGNSKEVIQTYPNRFLVLKTKIYIYIKK